MWLWLVLNYDNSGPLWLGPVFFLHQQIAVWTKFDLRWLVFPELFYVLSIKKEIIFTDVPNVNFKTNLILMSCCVHLLIVLIFFWTKNGFMEFVLFVPWSGFEDLSWCSEWQDNQHDIILTQWCNKTILPSHLFNKYFIDSVICPDSYNYLRFFKLNHLSHQLTPEL